MKKFSCGLAFILAVFVTSTPAQTYVPVEVRPGVVRLVQLQPANVVPAAVQKQAKPVKKAVKYWKGRKVDQKRVNALRKASVARWGPTLKRLPKATAASWDCRTLSLVPPIRDQRSCGSCWNFSGSSICTSALIKAGAGKADGSFNLSEQYTMDCGRNGGCNGDDNTTVTDWFVKTGIPTDDYGPYTASSNSCKDTSRLKMWKGQAWGFCTTTDTQGVAATQDIKNAMVAYGPIGAAVAAGGDAFWDSGTGTGTGTSHSIDHDVVIVGWDDNHDNGDGSKGAWIMRNSWSEAWGQTCGWNGCKGGYAWVKYGAYDLGTEAIWVTAGPAAAPVIDSPTTATASTSSLFSYTITASNAPASFAASGLPSGLVVDTSSGIISGTPTTAGTYPIGLTATSTSGSGTATLTLTVTGGPIPPGPPPTPGNVTVTLTAEQVASVIAQAGGVILTKDTTIGELLGYIKDAANRSKAVPAPKKPCCDKEKK